MRITYRPEQVREWTLSYLERLAGKLVIVNIRTDGHGRWTGAHGIVERGGMTHGVPFVEFDHGQGYEWDAGGAVFVSVCDEHGDHTSLNGVSCVDEFMLDVVGDTRR